MAGPDLKNVNVIPIGFGDILVDISSTHIAQTDPQLTHTSHGLGAMAAAEVVATITTFMVQAGNPQTIAEVIPVAEGLVLNCGFHEKTLRNLAIARGLDPTTWDGGTSGSGEIPLGNITAPVDLRVEGVFLFPDGTKNVIIFPRAKVIPNVTLGSIADAPTEVTIGFQALIADSNAPGSLGNAVWDTKPLGAIRQKLDS